MKDGLPVGGRKERRRGGGQAVKMGKREMGKEKMP